MSTSSTWRLIPPLNASGLVQMAIDTWLLDQHHLGLQPPTLRFYTWSPVAISLGYHQHRYPDAWNQLRWNGTAVDLVRRPTGGRAVLHQGDLTYAIVTSNLPGSRMDAYRVICRFLIQGWRSLNIDLQYGQAERSYIHNPNCFGTATGADLVLPDGVKFIGSAQRRCGSTILQHGSMRLNPDPALFQQVFDMPLETIHLPIHLINEDDHHSIIDALVASASDAFGVRFILQPLSNLEWQAVIRNSSDRFCG